MPLPLASSDESDHLIPAGCCLLLTAVLGLVDCRGRHRRSRRRW